jgi:hypothetical protein
MTPEERKAKMRLQAIERLRTVRASFVKKDQRAKERLTKQIETAKVKFEDGKKKRSVSLRESVAKLKKKRDEAENPLFGPKPPRKRKVAMVDMTTVV